MRRYSSWSALNCQLSSFLCDGLRGRVSYFLTRYHKVHNSYGRAAVRLDGWERIKKCGSRFTRDPLIFYAFFCCAFI